MSEEQTVSEQDMPLPKPLATSFGGHFAADIETRAELERFLEQATRMYGPSGERSTAEIGPSGSDAIVFEFALFDECAYLRHGDQVAVEPGLQTKEQDGKPGVARNLVKLVNNPMDEVETLRADPLLCTPQWVRGVVTAYATTGEIPSDITWTPAPPEA